MKTFVLILDGNRRQRETLAAALAHEDCHAKPTGDATSAMSLLQRHRFHLVLLDPSAPATGGWKTIGRLLLLQPDLPVIVLDSGEDHARSTLLFGAGANIGKPMDFSALLNAIECALAHPATLPVRHASSAHFSPL